MTLPNWHDYAGSVCQIRTWELGTLMLHRDSSADIAQEKGLQTREHLGHFPLAALARHVPGTMDN